MMPLSNKAARYAAIARKRYGKLTSFRLGIVVGEQSDAIRIPWNDANSLRLYAEGIEAGEDLRRRKDAQGMPREATRREAGSGASAPASPVTK